MDFGGNPRRIERDELTAFAAQPGDVFGRGVCTARVLDLDPVPRRAGPIGRNRPLQHDALEAHLAGLAPGLSRFAGHIANGQTSLEATAGLPPQVLWHASAGHQPILHPILDDGHELFGKCGQRPFLRAASE
jgi:hypothetical protein